MNNTDVITKQFEGTDVQFKMISGESFVKIDEVAKFCGWTTVVSGKEYPRMKRVNEKLDLLGFANVGKGDFIPESIMYPLIGMADFKKNEKAREFMLWVGQILVQLRTTGVVITASATSEAIDFEKKYGKYRIRRTFTSSSNIVDDYKEFKELSIKEDKAGRLTGQDRVKLMNIIFDSVEKRYKADIASLKGSEMLQIQELLTEIKSDTLILSNRVNGGLKSNQTKTIKTLTDKIASVVPEEDEYVTLPIHGFSVNSANVIGECPITRQAIITKSNAYFHWIQRFDALAPLLDAFSHIDFVKPVHIYAKYGMMEKYDSSNFTKSLLDRISSYFKVDDKMFYINQNEPDSYCDDVKDGYIKVCLKN